MYNPFELFTHPVFGSVRAAVFGEEILFVGKDIAEALGYTRPDKALLRHVAEEDRKKVLVPILDGKKNSMKEIRRYMIVINERGLYSLVLASQMPQAQEFKDWVVGEVLPSIRKTGSYSLFDETPFNKKFSAGARNAVARDFKLNGLGVPPVDTLDQVTKIRLLTNILLLPLDSPFKEQLAKETANLILGKNIF